MLYPLQDKENSNCSYTNLILGNYHFIRSNHLQTKL